MPPDDTARPEDRPARRQHGEATSPDDVAQRFLAELQRRVGNKDYECWFAGKVTVRFDASTVTLQVARSFLANWLQRTFRRPITSAATAVYGDDAIVAFAVVGELQATQETVQEPAEPNPPTPVDVAPLSQPAILPASIPQASIPQSSSPRKIEKKLADLSEFVIGGDECRNRIPYFAAEQAALRPGERQNPLFLFGKSGVGKTHLLQGIAKRLQAEHRDLRVELLTAEKFMNLFLGSIQRKTGPQFRGRFRSVDVLLVDNIDFLAGKEGTQREFLHTFDEIISRGCQIVLTAQHHPRGLLDMSVDLTSRFASGLTCRLETPDLETRIEICRRRSLSLGAKIKPAALRFVAEKYTRNLRDMIGCLNMLASHFELLGKPISGAEARRIIAEQEPDSKPPPTLEEIERAVCDFFHLRPKELKSPSRAQSLQQPRALAMYLAKELTSRTYTEIAAHFNRQHSTAIRADRNIRNSLEESATIRLGNGHTPLNEVLTKLRDRLTG